MKRFEREETIPVGKTVWIINQYASHLAERHRNLAENFARRGCCTVVFTSSFHHGSHTYLYDEDMHIDEPSKGVVYVYLHAGPEYGANGGKRMVNMLDFCRRFRSAFPAIAKTYGAPDYVIGSSAPPFMWELAHTAAKRFGAKMVAEFRDIWPMALVDIQGMSPSHPLVRYFGAMERRAYARADAIVGTMPHADRHVCGELGFPEEKFHWMPNGLDLQKADRALSDPELTLPPELDAFLSQHRCCIYVGSIVKSESIEYIVDTFHQVQNPEIYLAVVGNGNLTELVEEKIRALGTDRIRHFPAIRKEQIPLALKKAECCLAAHPETPIYSYGLSMNKLSDYLYAGKPVVFAFGWDSVVKDAGGYAVPFGDMQAMTNAIEAVFALPPEAREKLGAAGTSLIREQYDYRVIADRYLDMLEGL